MLYPFILRDITTLEPFLNLANKYFDVISPFEYGGILFTTIKAWEKLKILFCNTLNEFYKRHDVVFEFIRFNPFGPNPTIFSSLYEINKVNDNIHIDTSLFEEDFLKNTAHSVRKNYLRAKKEGLIFEEITPNIENIKIFIGIYYKTMDRLKSSKYYYFSEEYFKALLLKNKNAHLFIIKDIKNVVIATSILVCNEVIAHHHLTGSIAEFLIQRPNDLMIISLTKWCNSKGIKKIHLGGGPENIKSFKRKFSTLTVPYYIGFKIWNDSVYKMLNEYRFGKNTIKEFLPAYREGL